MIVSVLGSQLVFLWMSGLQGSSILNHFTIFTAWESDQNPSPKEHLPRQQQPGASISSLDLSIYTILPQFHGLKKGCEE